MDKLSISEMVEQLKQYNAAYRDGRSQISDLEYDRLVENLRALEPEHPFLHTVEPELLMSEGTVRHKERMLSTEKAYTAEALQRFVERVGRVAEGMGRTTLFRVTPKLDGMAGKDEGGVLASRGNGVVGNDITYVFERGVRPIGGRGLGPGEIVMVKSYFEDYFTDEFVHPRNMMSSNV